MNTTVEKISYIIGRQIGGDLVNQGIEIDVKALTSGMNSILTNSPSAISDNEASKIMQEFQNEMRKKAMARESELGGLNIEEGNTYRQKNANAQGVKVTDSGLQYKVIKSGTGKSPSAHSTVETHYEGTLINGTIFDSSYRRNQTATFPVNGVISGWTEALQMMKEGDVWELTIPPELAYGAQGAGGDIGPHATLIFKVELIKVM